VSIEVEVRLRSGHTLRMKSPTLLPELSSVASITACSPDYFGASIEFGGAACACCSPGMRCADLDLPVAAAPSVSLRASSSSAGCALPSTEQAADLQCLQRCSRCPQATVLYVKKKEAEVWNRESDIFQNVDKCQGSVRGKK
jgi:hypothetical protein